MAGGLLLAAATHFGPGVASWRRLRCRVMPRLAGVGDPRHVALTFDDGPDATSTPAFLETLDRLGWRATFFFLGAQVRRYPGLAAEVAARGHEVAVHGERHISHLRRPWPLPGPRTDVASARRIIAEATDTEPRWFRPPYGALSTSSLLAARRSQLHTVLWTTWGRDWRADATADTVAASIDATWHRGATVLLHDSDITSAPGSWRAGLEALPLLAEQWERDGLTVGPLAEHFPAW